MQAIFRLESGFDVGSGKLSQGGLLFGRQAYVGLSSGQYGSLTLGRQYDSAVDYIGPLTVGDLWGGTFGSQPGDINNFDNTLRTNNSIKFSSRSYGGLTFGGVYSLGGVAGDFSRNQIWSLGAGYTSGPLSVAAAYLNVRNSNVSFFGTSSSTPLTAATTNMTSPVYSGYASAHTEQVAGAGVNYTIGPATLGLVYSNIRFLALGNTAESGPNPGRLSGDATFNNIETSFLYRLTPAFSVGLEYNYLRGNPTNGRSSSQYHQGTVGVDYALSKRTDVYVIAAYQRASGTDSTGKTAVAAINGVTASSSNAQTAVSLALRHKF
ncbi:porin [Caballeronia calidae]|uniref:porin n=1 Tax=Caballeronia calidae TaxID=1777139 RepID=UPI002FC5D28C